MPRLLLASFILALIIVGLIFPSVEPSATGAQAVASPVSQLFAPISFGPAAAPSPTPVPRATPNPLSYECNIGEPLEYKTDYSYLTNTTFDGGFDGEVPFGWTEFKSINVRLDEEYGNEKFGDGGLRILGIGDFRAGIYQQVPTVAGRWYHAWYATAQLVYGGVGGGRDGSLPILREVGVDLTGGTDPNASTVQWGRPVGGQPDKDNKKYGGWKTLGAGNAPLIGIQATGPVTTMFIRASGWPDVTQSTTWIDSAFFVDACQGGYRPFPYPPPR